MGHRVLMLDSAQSGKRESMYAFVSVCMNMCEADNKREGGEQREKERKRRYKN